MNNGPITSGRDQQDECVRWNDRRIVAANVAEEPGSAQKLPDTMNPLITKKMSPRCRRCRYAISVRKISVSASISGSAYWARK